VFIQAVKNAWGEFIQEDLEAKIHASLTSKDGVLADHCFVYNSVDIQIAPNTKEIIIHIQMIDTPTQKMIDKFVPTGAILKIDRHTSSGPTMMA
jgi:hypothetical protein